MVVKSPMFLPTDNRRIAAQSNVIVFWSFFVVLSHLAVEDLSVSSSYWSACCNKTGEVVERGEFHFFGFIFLLYYE